MIYLYIIEAREVSLFMENIMSNINENIMFLRKQSNLTQNNIAEYLNVEQDVISEIERNEKSISSDMLDKISTLFGVSIEELTQESSPANQISFIGKIDENDLETISAINRIALNLELMTQLLKDYESVRLERKI